MNKERRKAGSQTSLFPAFLIPSDGTGEWISDAFLTGIKTACGRYPD